MRGLVLAVLSVKKETVFLIVLIEEFGFPDMYDCDVNDRWLPSFPFFFFFLWGFDDTMMGFSTLFPESLFFFSTWRLREASPYSACSRVEDSSTGGVG